MSTKVVEFRLSFGLDLARTQIRGLVGEVHVAANQMAKDLSAGISGIAPPKLDLSQLVQQFQKSDNAVKLLHQDIQRLDQEVVSIPVEIGGTGGALKRAKIETDEVKRSVYELTRSQLSAALAAGNLARAEGILAQALKEGGLATQQAKSLQDQLYQARVGVTQGTYDMSRATSLSTTIIGGASQGIQDFSYGFMNAESVLQGFTRGIQFSGNNLSFLLPMIGSLKAEAVAAGTSMRQVLMSSLTGTNALMLGLNLALAATNIVMGMFANKTDQAGSAASKSGAPLDYMRAKLLANADAAYDAADGLAEYIKKLNQLDSRKKIEEFYAASRDVERAGNEYRTAIREEMGREPTYLLGRAPNQVYAPQQLAMLNRAEAVLDVARASLIKDARAAADALREFRTKRQSEGAGEAELARLGQEWQRRENNAKRLEELGTDAEKNRIERDRQREEREQKAAANRAARIANENRNYTNQQIEMDVAEANRAEARKNAEYDLIAFRARVHADTLVGIEAEKAAIEEKYAQEEASLRDLARRAGQVRIEIQYTTDKRGKKVKQEIVTNDYLVGSSAAQAKNELDTKREISLQQIVNQEKIQQLEHEAALALAARERLRIETEIQALTRQEDAVNIQPEIGIRAGMSDQIFDVEDYYDKLKGLEAAKAQLALDNLNAEFELKKQIIQLSDKSDKDKAKELELAQATFDIKKRQLNLESDKTFLRIGREKAAFEANQNAEITKIERDNIFDLRQLEIDGIVDTGRQRRAQRQLDLEQGIAEVQAKYEADKRAIDEKAISQGVKSKEYELLEMKRVQSVKRLEMEYIKELEAERRQQIQDYTQSLVNVFADALKFKRQLSEQDISIERAELAQKERDLKASYQRRQIDKLEYDTQMMRLEKERGEFDKKVEADRATFLQRSAKGVKDLAISSIEDVLKKRITAYITENVFDTLSNKQKRAELLKTLGIKLGANAAETASNLKTAGSNMISGVASTIKSVMSSIPFPFNVLAVGAAVGGIYALYKNFKERLTGFYSGGYTGNVGKNNIAGVVHGNEVVMESAITNGQVPEWLALRKLAQQGVKVGDILAAAGFGFVNGGYVAPYIPDLAVISPPNVSVNPPQEMNMAGLVSQLVEAIQGIEISPELAVRDRDMSRLNKRQGLYKSRKNRKR